MQDHLTERATIFAARKYIGRNEPCFCGSGKKYKNCCHQYEQIINDIKGIDLNDGFICLAKWFVEKGCPDYAIDYYNIAVRSIPTLILKHAPINDIALSKYEDIVMGYTPILQWLNDFIRIAQQTIIEVEPYKWVEIINKGKRQIEEEFLKNAKSGCTTEKSPFCRGQVP